MPNTANPNTKYELLVTEILQAIVNSEGYENIRVEHNVEIIGRSGASHQMDVFWEFKIAGTTYRTCVECKNLQSSIKKTHVAAFAEILRDVDANGIIATSNTFQRGAKLLAAFNNIRLMQANYVIKSIHLSIQPRELALVSCNLQFNEAGIKRIKELNDLNKFYFHELINETTCLYDANGTVVTTMGDLIKKHKPLEGKNALNIHGLYWKHHLGLLPLEVFEFYSQYIQLPPLEEIITIDNKYKAVIEDIVSNNVHYLTDDCSITQHFSA